MNAIQEWDGELPSGGAWSIDVPRSWNGTLCVFSSGYGENAGGRADNAGDPTTGEILLREGFALAGSRAARPGWAVGDTLTDQVATVAEFRARVGEPEVTIAWGRSMGGLIAAALAQVAPEVIDGAVAMCASLAGPVPMLNQGLDAAFVLSTLCFPGEEIPLVGVRDDDKARLAMGQSLVNRSLSSKSGRARLALASAVAQLPTWSSDNLLRHRREPPEPGASDMAAKLTNQASIFAYVAFSPREDLEKRAGGNFSWNDGIDYTHQVAVSGLSDLVAATYEDAGMSLSEDLDKLGDAARVKADEDAVRYMEQNITPDGYIGVPVLTVSLTGDFAPTVTQTSAYADLVEQSGCAHNLRQVFVHAPGHCSAFSTAEVITSVQAMDMRLRTGHWEDLTPAHLNDRAQQVARSRSPKLRRPRFADFAPHPYIRPYPRGARLTPLTTAH